MSNNILSKNEYNLGATLYTSRWTYEQQIDSYTLLYSPDSAGMPILVSPEVQELYDKFSDGAVIGQVIQEIQENNNKGFLELFPMINELFERNLLRAKPDPKRFTPRPYIPTKKSLNIWLHINNYCNLACSYCFVEHTLSEMSNETIVLSVSNIVKTVEKYGVEDVLVKFAGGEPTLSLSLMELFHDRLAEKLKPTGAFLHWTVLTNGTNISKRFLKFVRKANATVSISIDGFGEYHDLYRVYRGDKNRGSWNIINRNITLLKENGIMPYINAMVGPKTTNGLPELASWVFGNGMIGTIHVVRNVGDSWEMMTHRRQQEYSRYCGQLQEAFEQMFCELEDESFIIKLPSCMEVAELYFDKPTLGSCCGIGADHIVIKHDGNLASCPMTVHENTVPVVAGDLFLATSNTFKTSPTEREDIRCLDCQWYRVCASACPVANERIKGHPFVQSPLCKFWTYVIPRYIEFYGRKLLQALTKRGHAEIWSGKSRT